MKRAVLDVVTDTSWAVLASVLAAGSQPSFLALRRPCSGYGRRARSEISSSARSSILDITQSRIDSGWHSGKFGADGDAETGKMALTCVEAAQDLLPGTLMLPSHAGWPFRVPHTSRPIRNGTLIWTAAHPSRAM